MESDIQVGQELSIYSDGRPFLVHWSRTWELSETGERLRPLAIETGFWRPLPNNEVELLLAHPTGIIETWFGKVTVTGIENAVITGARVELKTDAIVRTASAKQVDAGERIYGLVDGNIGWVYDMAAEGHVMKSHSSFHLTKSLTEESGA